MCEVKVKVGNVIDDDTGIISLFQDQPSINLIGCLMFERKCEVLLKRRHLESL